MRIQILGLAILMLGACQTTNANSDASKLEMIDRLFATFNKHDSQGLAEFYTEDAKVTSPESCEPTIGKAAIAANYQAMFDEIPDVHDTVKTVVIDGDKVALTFIASSQLEGREFELPIAAFMTIENGLIAADDVFFDSDVTPEC